MPREIVEISKITYPYGKFHNVPMICQIHMVYKMPVGGLLVESIYFIPVWIAIRRMRIFM